MKSMAAALLLLLGVAAVLQGVAANGGQIVLTGDSLIVAEGATTTFTVALDTAVAAGQQVTLTVAVGNALATVDKTSLTFTDADWDTAQTVTVTGVDNNVDASNGQAIISVLLDGTTDNNYIGASQQDTIVTIIDNDTAGITLSTPTLSVAENAGTDTFTVVLDSAPVSGKQVVLSVASSNPSVATVDTASLTFTDSTWNTPQTVTVTGVNNDVDAADATATVTVAVDGTNTDETSYTTSTASKTVTVTANDDDTAGFTLAGGPLTVNEAGGTDTFTAVLDSSPAPGKQVVLSVSVSSSVAGLSDTSLTFDSTNWDTAQTVTVTGVGNDVDAPDATVDITVAVDAATDETSYPTSMASKTVSVTNTDDDTAGFTIVGGPLTMAEDAGTGTFTVVLDSSPASGKTVVLSVTSSDSTVATASPATLTFDPTNWSNAQTVTITGVGNNVDAADATATITVAVDATTDETSYPTSMSSQTVTVTATDNDTAGITVAGGPLTVAEDAGTGTFTVVLDSSPASGNVVVLAVTSDDTDVATAAPAMLTFDSSNWSTAQTVTVTGTGNWVDAGADATAAVSVSVDAATTEASYPTSMGSETVAITATDNDVDGITLSKTSVTVAEASGTNTFTVVLDSSPVDGKQVVLDVVTNSNAVATVSPTRVTFLAADWSTAQTITVTGTPNHVDATDATTTVNVAVNTGSTDETSYTSSTTSKSVSVTSTDDDVAGISITSSSGAILVTEPAGTDDIAVALDSQPTGTVVLVLASSDTAVATVSPSTMTFTPSNWNVDQAGTVTAANDHKSNGGIVFAIVAAVTTGTTAAEYASLTAEVASAVHANDDVAGITLSKSMVTVAEDGGVASFTVGVDTAPDAGKKIVLTVSSSNTDVATVSVATVTFTDSDWQTPIAVTVTGVGNDVDATTSTVEATITVATGGSGNTETSYNAAIASKTVTVAATDNDSDGITLNKSSVNVLEAAGTGTFTAVCNSAPAAGKSIALDVTSADTTIVTVAPAKLVFTAANWDTPQTVTVTGVPNFVDAPDATTSVTVSVNTDATTEPSYTSSTVSKSVSSTSYDDDSAAISVSPFSVTAGENGGSATFTALIDSEPAAGKTVVLNVASSNTGISTVSPATLTFTPSNWNVRQTVTVTNVNNHVDNFDTTPSVTVSVKTGTGGTDAPAYTSGIAAQSVTMTSVNEDADGITLSTTAVTVGENGGTGTFTAVVDSAPVSGKVIVLNVATADASIATVANPKLTFTSTNWNTAQTVTLTGVDNDVDIPDSSTTITVSVDTVATTEDSYIVGTASKTLTVTSTDEDTAGFTFSTASQPIVVAEPAGTSTASIVLHTEPSVGNVVLNLASSKDEVATISPATVTFTAGNWNVAQTLTISSTDNMIADGSLSYSVTATVNDDVSPVEYAKVAAQTLTGRGDDNEMPSLVLSAPIAVGIKNTIVDYSVVLDTEPKWSVVVDVAWEGEHASLTLSPSTLTFTPHNWDRAQTVTVTLDPEDVETDYSASIKHSVSAVSGSYTTDVTATQAVTVDGVPDPLLGLGIAAIVVAVFTAIVVIVYRVSA